jgi:hypothetical protein
MEITLETGSTDRVVSIPPFDTLSTLEVEYVVQRGDNTDSLEVNGLSLADEATLQNSRGDSAILTIGLDRRLSNYKVIGLDGVPPQISVLSPASNDVMLSPMVSYELSERLESGSIEWKDGFLDGEYLPDSVRAYLELNDSDLTVGIHEIRLSGDSLVEGATYTVVISLTDSVGNFREIVLDLVKIIEEVTAIKIKPADTTAQLGDYIQFSAVGVDGTKEYELDTVSWTTPSLGMIDQQGNYMVMTLGESKVVASYSDSVSDTATVTADSASVDIPPDGDGTVLIGRDVELIFPPLSHLQQTLMEVLYMEDALRPEGLNMVGPALIFSEHTDGAWVFETDITMRLRIDPTKVSNEDLDRIQVYMRGETDTDPWTLVPSTREGYWLLVETDSLGAYIVALDMEPPVLSWGSSKPETAEEGEQTEVMYTASDNIANPRVRLRVHTGGSTEDVLIDLEYKKDERSTAVIPDSLVTPMGLWYTIEIGDSAHTVSLDTVDLIVTLTKDLAMPGSMVLPEDRYNMISIPLNPADKSVEALLLDDLGPSDPTRWRLFAYDSSFAELDGDNQIRPGRSYWLRTQGFEATIDLDSVLVRTLPVSRSHNVPLHAGWNCLSNPFLFNVDAGGVSMDSAEAQYLYVYEDEEWKTGDDVSSLAPWKGFLVWNGETGETTADSVMISPVPYDASSVSKVSSHSGVRIGVRVTSGGHRDGRAVMAFDYAGSTQGLDKRDFPKPMMVPKPLDISMVVHGDEKQPYLTDYRGELGEGQGWLFKVRSESGGTTVLEFLGLEGLLQSTGAIMLDRTSGVYRHVNGPVLEYNQTANVDEEFEIHIGTPEYLKERIHEFNLRYSKFYLGQNFPNPFVGATTIQYSLPGSRDGSYRSLPVRLEVYDIMGRPVVTLVSGRQEPGPYSVTWSRANGRGRPVPAGAYFYRLRVGSNLQATKKMLLLR